MSSRTSCPARNKKNRLVVLGLTNDKRFLKAVLENQGAGIYYVVTAYEASTEDKTLYMRLRGGDYNDTDETKSK